MSAPDAEDVRSWLPAVCRELALTVDDLDANFFDAGGTSLTAVKLIARAEDTYGEDVLTPEDLFAAATLEDVAKSIEHNRQAVGSANP